MNKEWFEKWFDTDYYHLLYSHRDEGEARDFLKNLITFLRLPTESKVIDIGCGRGRHARFLSQNGFDVTGIDIASASIKFASQFENDHLHFHCFDKRNIFKKESFDLALNLFTSFGFLKNRNELESAMKMMGLNLKKGGIFVLDYMNAEKIKHTEFHTDIIDIQSVKFEIRKKIVGHQIIKDIRVTEGNQIKDFKEEVHLITLPEFEDLFSYASMKILHTFGSYRLENYDELTSDRLILVAEKI